MTVVNTETGEIVNAINYAIHPVAALFPFIEGEAFREFVEDIRENGQREPVVLDASGRLLDGRNRARACQALGIDVKETRYSGDDAESWIISHNVHRRHLTTAQRAMVAGRLADMRSGERTDLVQNETRSTSLASAASALDVSRASAAKAKAIVNSGDDELIKAVESGSVSLNAAEAQVKAKAIVRTSPDARAVEFAGLARLAGQRQGVDGLMQNAYVMKQQTGSTLPHCVAAASVDIYNRGRGGKKLPSWWKSDA